MKNYINVKSIEELSEYLKEYIKFSKNKEKKLYHFTTYESLISILKNKTFRLSLIGESNDKAEITLANQELIKNLYIMSFKEDERENVNMWAMYGKPSGIKIRIDFSKEELVKCLENGKWSFNENEEKWIKRKRLFDSENKLYVLSNVAYLSKNKNDRLSLSIYRKRFVNLKISSIDEIKKSYDLSGFVKYDIWENEREVRLRICPADIETQNDRKHLYLKLTDELIKTIHITFNPWLSDVMKEEIKKSLNGLCDGFELSFDDSAHNKEISEM